MPIAGSTVLISGRPHSMSDTKNCGTLIVTVEDIVYNPGANLALDDSRTSPTSNRKLQVKKRKFGEIAVAQKGMRNFSLLML